MFRPIRSSLIAALLLTATSTSAQLNGTYTIGTAGNYATFTAAVTALTTSGVSGPVIFNVFSGIYNEQLNIGAIAGASAANTILFRSQGLDNSLVTLDHPSQATNTNDYLLQLNGCDRITFQHITLQRSGALDYARIVNVLTGSTDWHFLNDRFISSTSTSTTGSREMIAIAGPAIGASSLEDCTMTNGMGPYLSFVSSGSFTMSRNSLTNVLRGLNLNSWSNGTFLMEDNVITTRATGSTRGALFDFCSGNITVRRNTFTGASNLFSGLLFNTTSGTVGTPIKVEGNVIIGTTTALNGISAMNGICSYIDVSNNSVNMSGAGGQAMVVVVGSGTGIRIRNNIFRSAGYTLRVDPASRVSASDNNVFRSLAGNSVQWGPSWYATIAALNAATGMNGNSLMTEPQFVDPLADLHLQGTSPCLGAGQVIAGMGADLDGDARPLPALSNPEIGADETTAQCAALSGTYIIGPSVAADHPTFNSAANAMISCGIAGPVLFLVESGTYTEQITLPPIAGNSATNTITFRGQALDSAAAVLEWPTGATMTDDWVVRMTGADYVRFERLTLQRTGTDQFGNVVSYAGTDGSRDVRISNCKLATANPTIQQPSIIFHQTTMADDSLVVLSTRFQGGSYGIYMASAAATDHVRIEHCVAVGQSLEAFHLDHPGGGITVLQNTITSGSALFGGIVIGARTAGFRIERNNVVALGALAIGIRTTAGVVATTGSRGRIRNNMVHTGLTAFATFGTQRWMEVDNNTFYGSVRGVAFAFSTFQ
ncbi:MAG: right-handed parallel beta-helix repeat-containing protein, partial [Flavobacteriales bacterium]|nr:right-handed parallel beta-helix repeat-containing protein [Flavobacteriales bacterium]